MLTHIKFKITAKSLFNPERLANYLCRLFLVMKLLAGVEDRQTKDDNEGEKSEVIDIIVKRYYQVKH